MTEDFQNFPHQHMEKQIQIFKCIFAILSFEIMMDEKVSTKVNQYNLQQAGCYFRLQN